MELMRDVTAGGWLIDRVGDWGLVGGVAGTGFDSYARILHPVPVTRWDRSVVDEWGMPRLLEETRWPWSEVAARQGLTTHPLVQFNRLADVHEGVELADGWRVGQTQEGFFDLDLLAGLTEHLAVATTTPDDLVTGIWAGWGQLGERGVARYLEERSGWLARRRAQREADIAQQAGVAPEVRRAVNHGPCLQWPGREMLLLATSTSELADRTWPQRAGLGADDGMWEISPQLLWPADRAWVVASEIDWDSTIVAGPRSLVDAVLADERFEAFEVDADADLSYEGDTVNPPRGGWTAAP
ncbi:hypothetical protein [Janibacter sp. LM]|uniref:hypothetical protein n=1 Tax=Janibacter sp. LM TaxID=3144845 RepID=UPI0031F7123C